MPFDLDLVRSRFPALAITDEGVPRIYLDNPAGTQVPDRVAKRMTMCLHHSNANLGGYFSTSQAAGEVVQEARDAGTPLGVTRRVGETLAKIENGPTSPPVSTLIRIARALIKNSLNIIDLTFSLLIRLAIPNSDWPPPNAGLATDRRQRGSGKHWCVFYCFRLAFQIGNAEGEPLREVRHLLNVFGNLSI